jgi:hypothetical protein
LIHVQTFGRSRSSPRCNSGLRSPGAGR